MRRESQHDQNPAENMAFCRITGQRLPPYTGRGRPIEYVNADARELALRLAQLSTLVDRLGPLMTPEAVRAMKGEFYTLGNQLNPYLKAQRKPRGNG